MIGPNYFCIQNHLIMQIAMKYFFTLLFLFILLVGPQTDSFAQSAYYNQILFNLSPQVGVPLDRFRENLDAVGFGGGASFLFRLRDKPVYMGLAGSWMNYANEKDAFTVQVDGFFEDYEWRTNSNILLGHAVLRFQPDVVFPLKPYVDGMIGFKNLYTKTKLVDLNGEEDEVIERESNLNDWAFSYGGAAGLHIAFWEHIGIRIDLKVAYLQGANARYLARMDNTDGQVFTEPIEAFEERVGPTNMLVPQIGIVLDLLYLAESGEE